MIKVDVKKAGVLTHSSQFATQDEVDAWISEQQQISAFGKNERGVIETELSAQNENPDQASSVTGEAPNRMYHFAAEYTIEQSDVTAAVQAKADVLSRSQVRIGCELVVDHIADYNKKHLDQAAMNTLFSQSWFGEVALALLLGAPTTAQALIVAHGPSVYPQDAVDEIAALLEPLK